MTVPLPQHAGLPGQRDTALRELVRFALTTAPDASPGGPLHQAKRLLLNRLWASATAAAQPDAQVWLRTAAAALPPPAAADQASLWWRAPQRSTACAAAGLNRRLARRQPHAATHLPSTVPTCPDLLPGLLARAEAAGRSGTALLRAWAIGTELGLAQAAARQAADAAARVPTADLGALVAGGLLRRTPADGLAAQLRAALATDTPEAGAHTADGTDPDSDDGLAAVVRELPVPGQPWRLQSLLLHTRPVAAVALAPLEAVLRLRDLDPLAVPAALTVHLSPEAWPLADDGDVAYAVATAWLCGQYTLDEALPAWRQSPTLLALRGRVDLQRDPALRGLGQARVVIERHDGLRDQWTVDRLLGAPEEALSDGELSELFRQAADALVLPRRAGEILMAVWGLERLDDAGQLARLLCRPA